MHKDLIDGVYKDPINGKYERILYVRTLNGKTISVKYDPQATVDQIRKQIEGKTRIPQEQQHPVSRGKVLKDKMKIEDYNLKEEETIELIAALLGGTKRDESRPISRTEEREAKRRASEPCIDISGQEDNRNASKASEGNMKTMMQKMEETLKAVSFRMDDISSFEQSMASANFQITDLNTTMHKMYNETQARDRKFVEAISQVSADNRARDQN